jgi:hypothetical protein
MVTETYRKGYKTVYNAVLDAAEEMELDVLSESFEKGIIKLKYNGSLFSYGNSIRVKLNRLTRGCEIKITSESSAAVQVIDWGTNDRLEDELLELIEEILE